MLQFILGDIMSDKQQWCVDDMSELLLEKRVKKVFYLVPNHSQFDSEKQILTLLQHKMAKNVDTKQFMSGAIDIQIFGFSRLAWFLLKETGVLSKTHLSKTGLQMLLRHILMIKEKDLGLYRGEIKKTGFIEQLTNVFLECRQGNITTDDFELFVKTYATSSYIHEQDMAHKMAELKDLYNLFNQSLIGQYIEKEDLYDLMTHKIDTLDLSDTVVYIHGFEAFSAKEQNVIVALMKKAFKVSLALPLVSCSKSTQQTLNALSYIPEKTYRQLYDLAKQNNIKIMTDIRVSFGKERYTQDMQSIIHYWYHLYEKGGLPNDKQQQQSSLSIHECASKEEEISAVVNEITLLVSSGNYRYKDIQVFVRQFEEYEGLLQPLFNESHIPIFIDTQETMTYHPLYELLASLYDVQRKNWRYNDVMRLLKTNLLPVGDKLAIAKLENELLAQGYDRLYWWTNEQVWENEDIRQRIVDMILPFVTNLSKCTTMKEAASQLYTFCVSSQIVQTIQQWRDSCIDTGDLQRAKQHEQAWQTFVQLLDEFVTLLGEEVFQLSDFYMILLSGFEQASYSLVPPSLDQVTMSQLDSRQVSPKKIVFVIGATSTQFPKSYANKTLLSDEERTAFTKLLPDTKYLSLPANILTMVEPFKAYRVLASATEKIYFSYPKTEHNVSTYLTILANRFTTKKPLARYGHIQPTLRQLIKDIRYSYDTNEPLSQLSLFLLQVIDNMPLYKKPFDFLKSSFVYKNSPKPLTNALELYKGQLHLSVSQLESYYKDPYSHFLQYGLQLKERSVLSLKSSDIGNVFHDVLDQLFKTVPDIKALSETELTQVARQVLEQTFNQPKYHLFHRTNSMLFSKQLLSDTLIYTIHELQKQAQLIQMETIATEKLFSSVNTHDSLQIEPISLSSEHSLFLRGKIDRIDMIDHQYLSIVDYKSSKQIIDFNRFYEGISLQLMTYLYVMSQQTQMNTMKKPMGAFYYPITYPYETVSSIMAPLESLQRQSNKLTGLLTLSAEELLQIGEAPNVFQASVTKKGDFNKVRTMPVVTSEELKTLFAFLNMKIVEAGKHILLGDIQLSPIKNESFIPSLNEFRSVSLFDATLPENNYRVITPINNIMEQIKKKVGDINDTH